MNPSDSGRHGSAHGHLRSLLVRSVCVGGVLAAGLLLGAQPAEARPTDSPGTYDLTLREALNLARQRSPTIRAARTRIEEARGGLVGVSPLLSHNPTLELEGGPRISTAGVEPDVGVHIGQVFELGGQRAARVAAASAKVDEAEHQAGDTGRRVLGAVAAAFLQARYEAERIEVARSAEQLVLELQVVAERRSAAGEGGRLDVELAGLAVAGAQAEVRQAEVRRDRAVDTLRVLLGLDPDASLSVGGELLERRAYVLEDLRDRSLARPDLQVIDARIRAAEAGIALGEAEAWPDLGVKLGYAREESSNLILGGISLSLPAFDRGEGIEATSRAQRETLRIELEASRVTVRSELRAALDAYRRLSEAVATFEETGLPRVQAGEALARRGYEAGAIPLGELLVILRELAQARATHTDLLYETARAMVDLETIAGVL